MTHHELSLQLAGHRLILAEILYHMPDHPDILQSFIWQELDIAPKFPRLNKFLTFWDKSLDGKVHSVRLVSRGIISAAEMRYAGGEWIIQ